MGVLPSLPAFHKKSVRDQSCILSCSREFSPTTEVPTLAEMVKAHGAKYEKLTEIEDVVREYRETNLYKAHFGILVGIDNYVRHGPLRRTPRLSRFVAAKGRFGFDRVLPR